MKIITPPIKSQGIKTKLVPAIMQLKPNFNGRWIEPFLGTGVVAFNSGAKQALLSDINPHIINFYSRLQDGEINPEKIRQFLFDEGQNLSSAGERSSDYYKFVRDRFNSNFDSLDFLFLSRAGFNGMIRFNKNGKWNIPFCKKPERFSKSYITKIVHQSENCKSVMTDRWTFENKDFREIISQATEDDFIYCDPPYAGRYADYYSSWTENLKKYERFKIVTQEHFYFAGAKEENRNSMTEALVLNYEPEQNILPCKTVMQQPLFPELEKELA